MTIKNLLKFGFSKCGEFELTQEKIVFRSKEGFIDKEFPPKVYAWVSIEGNSESVIYIGKTSYSIKKRMSQHRQGFKGKINNGSLSGAKKFLAIQEIIEKTGIVEVWAREPANLELNINGELIPEPISLYSVEEEFFISLFKPELNDRSTTI